MTMKLGKKPATYDARDLKYADIRPRGVVLPAIPYGWGRGKDFQNGPPPHGWGMAANGPDDTGTIPAHWAAAQGAGDCTFAGPFHEERQAAHDSGKPDIKISPLTLLKQYATITAQENNGQGYDPISGANDNGCEVRDVLNYRQSTGLLDDVGISYKIGAYISIELGNWRDIQEACWLFECVGIGFSVPQSAMDQFNAGQAWSVVPGMMNNVLGGHYVPIVGHPVPGLWTCVTWGARQLLTAAFITATVDEIWAYLDIERYNQVTGLTYNGYASADLERYISAVGTTPTSVSIQTKITKGTSVTEEVEIPQPEVPETSEVDAPDLESQSRPVDEEAPAPSEAESVPVEPLVAPAPEPTPEPIPSAPAQGEEESPPSLEAVESPAPGVPEVPVPTPPEEAASTAPQDAVQGDSPPVPALPTPNASVVIAIGADGSGRLDLPPDVAAKIEGLSTSVGTVAIEDSTIVVTGALSYPSATVTYYIAPEQPAPEPSEPPVIPDA